MAPVRVVPGPWLKTAAIGLACLLAVGWWWKHSQPNGPERAVWRYLDALHAGDATEAHELLCPDVRSRVDVADLQAAVDDMVRRHVADDHSPGDEGAGAPDGYRYVYFTRAMWDGVGDASTYIRALEVSDEGWRACPHPAQLTGSGMG